MSFVTAGMDFVDVDLEVDFHSIDETGYLWTRLSDARDPSLIKPGVVLVVADGEALAMSRIVDHFEVDGKNFVHLEVLPGTVDDYIDYAERHVQATD